MSGPHGPAASETHACVHDQRIEPTPVVYGQHPGRGHRAPRAAGVRTPRAGSNIPGASAGWQRLGCAARLAQFEPALSCLVDSRRHCRQQFCRAGTGAAHRRWLGPLCQGRGTRVLATASKVSRLPAASMRTADGPACMAVRDRADGRDGHRQVGPGRRHRNKRKKFAPRAIKSRIDTLVSEGRSRAGMDSPGWDAVPSHMADIQWRKAI
jgi:hypothetical protein